jgi:hypothetical protein
VNLISKTNNVTTLATLSVGEMTLFHCQLMNPGMTAYASNHTRYVERRAHPKSAHRSAA